MASRTVPPGFRDVPNVGPAIAADFGRLGFDRLSDLRGKDPRRLYDELCRVDGARHDPCVLYTFHAVVDQANGKPARPWWHYSRKRLAARQASKRGRR